MRVSKFQPPIQEIQNGGGILPEEDSCVISEVVSDVKEDEAKVTNVNWHFFKLTQILLQETNYERPRQDSADFKIRLQKELVSRDGHKWVFCSLE